MSSTIKLTRRRVLASLLVISLAAAAAGAGTMAYFSDTEASTGNTVAAGTLDLKVNGGDSTVQLLSVSNAAPGDNGENSTSVSNNGSIDGEVDVSISFTASENGTTDPESGADAEGPGAELNSTMTVTVGIDKNNDGDAADAGEWNTTGTLDAVAGSYDNVATLNASESADLIIKYDIPTTADNAIQSDSVTIDATVTLEQASDD